LKINTIQKNGILQLAIILGFLFILLFIKNKLPNNTSQIVLDKKLQAELDKQKLAFSEKQNAFIKTYYVNAINDFSGYQLGLSTKQINTLFSYKKSGKLIYNLNEFQKIINADSAQLSILKNKLRFPKKKFTTKIPSKVFLSKKESSTIKKFDLNKITAIQLEKELKLPSFIAKRIVRFRKYLNGYKNINQIEKVYSILPYQIERVKKHCTVK